MKKDRLYFILRFVLRPIIKILYKPKVYGLDKIDCDSFILAGNHESILDPVILMCTLDKEVHFLAKKELTKGLKGVIFNNMGIIPVDRSIHDSNALKEGINALNNGLVIGIFPEGTTRKNGEIKPFKIGAVKMASECNKPIIPFVIRGKYKIFGNSLEIEFLDKIYIKNKDDLTKDNENLRNIIISKVGR